MKKLKILYIGSANSIHVERMMIWLTGRGHEVSILTNTPKKIPGVMIYDIQRQADLRPRLERYKDAYFNINWKWLLKLNEIIRVKKMVDEIKPDIVHSHTLWYPGYLGVYLCFHPYVITVLNGDVLWKKENVDFSERVRTKWAIKRADLITGESQTLMDACVRHGADKSKVHVTRNGGIDLTRFNCNGDKAGIRRELKLPLKANIILSPRNTGWFYNLDKIVKAIPKVIKSVGNVTFVFIWHSPDTDKGNELLGLASSLGVKDAVKIVGYVNHDVVAMYHRASDVMVSVSDRDSGPVALQEAMACGDVPVISDLPSVREWIQDGWNGLLVDPTNIDQIADSIVTLVKNEEMSKAFAERNWRLIQEKGDQKYWMKKMEDMYYSLIKY